MAGVQCAEDVLGRNFFDFVALEDLTRYREFHAKICAGRKGSLEFDLINARGERRHMESYSAPLRSADGSVAQLGVTRDITARKEAEQKLRESELNLRQLTETIPEMLWSATPEGTIDYCNARVLSYTGFSNEEIMTAGWAKLLHPDDVDHAVRAWTSCVATGSPYRLEVRTFHAADHTYRWCVMSALPLRDQDGHILKWHGTVVDMHDWRHSQEELRKMQAELAHVTRVIMIGNLTASIAHEVNQPLGAIIANAETSLRRLAGESPDYDRVRRAVEWIAKDARRAGDVIQRVRGLCRKADTEKVPLDVNEVIGEVNALLHRELAAQRVTLRLELAPSLPLVMGDRVQLQQVIINLVMNAVEAMQAATSATNTLVVRSSCANDGIVIAVKDSGVGISDEARSRLFDAFFSTKPDGLGIGLSICRSIIEDHEGQLSAANNSGEPGATFKFELPFRLDQAPDLAQRVG